MIRRVISAAAGIAVIILLIVWLAREDRPSAAPPAIPTTTQSGAPAAAAEQTQSATGLERAPARATSIESTPAAPTPTPAPAESASAEILVRGSVRDEQGQAVSSAGLRWIDARGSQFSCSVANGEYALPGMHAGSWLVEIVSSGWHKDQIDAVLDPQPELQQRNFTAHANSTIRIKVVDPGGAAILGMDASGRNLPGSRLRAYASLQAPGPALAPEELKMRAHSDCADFKARWELHLEGADCLGELELFENPPLSVSLVLGCAVLATQRIETVPPELVFTLSAERLQSSMCTLRLRAVKADGRTAVSSGMAMLNAQGIESHNLDAEGRAEFTNLLPGGYALSLMSPGSSRQQRRIVLEPGQALDLGDMLLAPAATLAVRLEFPGAEQPPVSLVLKPEVSGDPLATLGALDDSTIGAQGTEAKIPFPGAGRYELRVTRVGDPRAHEALNLGARPQRVDLGDAPAGELVVRILPTTMVCLLPPHESRGVSRWLVSTADGLPCQRVRIEGRAPTKIELVPGEYTIARIDPETKALGKAQAFTVGGTFSSVDLQP